MCVLMEIIEDQMALCDVLSDKILPSLNEALQAQERLASKRRLLDAMPRKRSERIKVKVALQAQEEELRIEQIEMEREAEEKRVADRRESVSGNYGDGDSRLLLMACKNKGVASAGEYASRAVCGGVLKSLKQGGG